MIARGITTVTAALAIAIGLLAPAGAAPTQRGQGAASQAAVIAEVVAHGLDQGVQLPKRMTRAKLDKRFGYPLPQRFSIRRYARLDATTYRICIVKKSGGWATWHSGKGRIRSGSHGAACRF
ncbi:hypothetical protein [Nocardioides sp. L-11A]|uniref:hypothetical protein n=1 Tax=Nocardioides sp. L-11A TaxID=3043848 RepID=UPI00249A15BC|nr:hypothetical protein QJ852_21085 [Nocardioides sp. L-11A]